MLTNDAPKIELHTGSSDFYIRIMFRQNGSWQGEIRWIESNSKIYFRSSLELMLLIHEAVNTAKTPHAEFEMRTWNDAETAAL